MWHIRITTFVKGLFVGSSMLIPGVSGGTMAILLGIYHKLISAVASFSRNKRKNLLFLLTFGIGGGLGMVLLAGPLSFLTEKFPMFMHFFFMGAVAGSIPMLLKEAKITKFRPQYLLYIGLGICMIVLLSFLPDDVFGSYGDSGWGQFLLLMIAGFAAAVALVLPGISVSYLFLVLGLYEDILAAMDSFDILFLTPVGIGLLVGIFLTTKGLEQLMEKFPVMTYLVILGFVLASVAEIFPGVPQGWHWISCISGFCIGFIGLYRLSLKNQVE